MLKKVPAFLFLASCLMGASAHAGHDTTQSEIRALYQGLPTNKDNFDKLMRMSLENPLAALYSGIALETGKGVTKDVNTALENYRICADKLFECAHNAGRLLYIQHRYNEAIGYLVTGAGKKNKEGLTQSMVLLGRIYETGQASFGRSYSAAFEWYEAAASHRDVYATSKLGEFLLHGLGRPANYPEARYYLNRAASAWSADAQYLMGDMYARGVGLPADAIESGKWFIIYSSTSNDAKARSQPLIAALSEKEYDAAKKMAQLWVDAHPSVETVDYLSPVEPK
jgi:TPR repeat protein